MSPLGIILVKPTYLTLNLGYHEAMTPIKGAYILVYTEESYCLLCCPICMRKIWNIYKHELQNIYIFNRKVSSSHFIKVSFISRIVDLVEKYIDIINLRFFYITICQNTLLKIITNCICEIYKVLTFTITINLTFL